MTTILLLLVSLGSPAAQSAGPEFPAAEPGYRRIHIEGARGDSRLFTLSFARKASGDCFNSTTHLRARMELRSLEGWGYDYYVLTEISGPFTPGRAACHPAKDRLTSIHVRYEGSGSEQAGFFRHFEDGTYFYVPEDVELSVTRWSPSAPERK